MEGTERETTAEELLAHSAWLRRLALRLVHDADVADDLVQETWIAAVRRVPDASQSLRPWLAKVLRDAFRMRARSEGRRSAREQAASIVSDDVPTPEFLVARAEAQRRLVDLVLRLEEPYRGAVLLHFCEGVSLADIARAQGVPAGTVRWRMKVAIDQLRAQLDQAGDRRQWALTLLALPKGVLVAQKTSKIAIGLVLLLLLAVGGIFTMVRHAGTEETGDHTGGSSPALSASGGGSGSAGATEQLPAWLGQRDLGAIRIAGRVTTLDGAPVTGASVELASLATAGGLLEPSRRITNAAGEFDFGPQLAMHYTVHASAPGMTGAALGLDLRDPVSDPRPDRIELKLGPCERAMVGTVRDASGGPIAGARIAWLRGGGPRDDMIAGMGVATSSAGEFELCVEGGRAAVVTEVSADGYGAIVMQTQIYGRDRFDFSLVPEATVVGRVIREDSGRPVAQAYVSLSPGQWGAERTARREVFSGSDGRFHITGVAPGRHVVQAIGDGLATARETPIVVEAGQTSDEIELVLETRSTVRGVVMGGGKPVPGALIRARTNDPGRESADAVSQEDGSFVLDRVPRGQVRFIARPYEVLRPESFQVERPEHDGVAIEVDALGAIIGRMVRNGRPVDQAELELHGPNSRELEQIRTGPDGRFEARGLRPGTWIVYGSSEADGAFGRAPDVELQRGQTAEVTIDLEYAAAIAGVVVDQDGAPVPGVTVVFTHSGMDDVGVATTATDGSFRAATMIGGGDYRVTVRARAGSSGVLRPAQGGEFPPVTLANGTSEVTDLVLAVRLDRLSIAGRVVDESGAPVPDARVAADMVQSGVEPRFGRWRLHSSSTTDTDGQFSIGDLSAGTYAVQARSNSGAEAIARGVVAGREDVAIVLPSPGAVEGSLEGFKEPPRVFATRQDGNASGATARGTVTGTTFLMQPLTPGTYIVSARTGTQAASARVEVTTGATAHVTLTSTGSGSVAGRVRDFHSGAPAEGMTCVSWPRMGTDRTSAWAGNGVRTDRDGAFELTSAPAGDIAVVCHGSGSTHSDGLRLVTVPPSQRLEVDVPVVRIRQDVSVILAGIGADFDEQSFIARLHRVRPGGPAATAGLQDGDVVIAVDGAAVTELSPRGVWFLVANREPGTTVKLTVRRAGKNVAASLLLGPPGGR
jgi:RNA polymerase sigma-70 factor (ECF subfamily)